MAEFNPEKMLEQLRWKEDMAVFNSFGEHVWIKALYNDSGLRIGITDCCFVDKPCKWHQAVTEEAESRNAPERKE